MTRGADSSRGMTILEIMIVLLIIGLMMLIGLPAIRSFVATDLRNDVNQVASTLRASYEMATLSGIHHRVLFDLDTGTFEIQACPEEMRIKSGRNEKLVDKAVVEELARPTGGGSFANGPTGAELTGSEGPEAAVAAAAALAGVDIGGSRCEVPKTPNGDADARGNARSVHKDRGIRISEVNVQHLDKPATAGKVAINAFPLGWSEKAVVELATAEGDHFTILVHGMTGKIEIHDGEIDVDRHMRRDAAGDQEIER